MAIKRTKRQKIKTAARRVNTQLTYNFDKSYNQISKKDVSVYTDKINDLGTIKKELYKSLIIATLILISLVVVYWFS